MNYHIYECDRCHDKAKGLDLPNYWTHVTTNAKEIDLCSTCYTMVEAIIRKPELGLIDLSIYERTLKAQDAKVEMAPDSAR